MAQRITEFENPGYFVRSLIPNAPSDVIIVSFTGVGAVERDNGSFFGEPLAKALNIPFIGLVARTESWYLEDGIDDALSASRDVTNRVQAASPAPLKVIGYGVSMGGYAAVKYSRTLDFDAIIALAPILSIDFDETGRENFCSDFFQPYMKGMAPKNDEVVVPCYLFYDPYNKSDKIEADAYCDAITSAKRVPVPFASHMVAMSLKGSKNFDTILRVVMEGGDLQAVIRQIRIVSAENVVNILLACFHKNIKLLMPSLTSHRASVTGGRDKFLMTKSEAWYSGARLVQNGLHSEALALFRMLRAPAYEVPLFTKLLTWTGECVCFDPIGQIFHQTERHRIRHGELVVIVNETVFSLSAAGLEQLPYSLQSKDKGFTLSAQDGTFLSARPDRQMSFVPWADLWEVFLPFRPDMSTSDQDVQQHSMVTGAS